MDLSVESGLTTLPGSASNAPGLIAGRPLEDWNAAYEKVESYFHALRVRNKLLMNRLVLQVLKCAMERAPIEPDKHVVELAGEELDAVVTEWFAKVLQESDADKGHALTTRGRLALLLADMPGKWQDQFLQPGPWPAEFVKAMREAYLRAGPDFQLARMAPRPLDLGPIATLTSLRFHYKRWLLLWILGALVLIGFFLFTHSWPFSR